jgi:hypothetical protein
VKSIFYPWREMRAPVPRQDAGGLFHQHWRFFFHMARRWYFYAAPFDRRSFAVEDFAAELFLIAVRGFGNWKPDRVSFLGWVAGLARSHAGYLRERAMRKGRAVVCVSQFGVTGGDGFDRFALTADPRQREPWELAAEREE